jgi:hypothetical protein
MSTLHPVGRLHYIVTWSKTGGHSGGGRAAWYRDVVLAGITDNGTRTVANANDTVMWLGHSQFTADNIANADYNEVRIYSRAHGTNEINFSRVNGPDNYIAPPNHTFRGTGSDPFGAGTMQRPWDDGSNSVKNAQNRARVAFISKLGAPYYCWHDRDVAPEGKTLAESNKTFDAVAKVLKEVQKRTGVKLLWGTANLFSNPCFVHGASTSCNADVFAFAAAQVKKAMEVTQELGGEGYTFWGGRELPLITYDSTPWLLIHPFLNPSKRRRSRPHPPAANRLGRPVAGMERRLGHKRARHSSPARFAAVSALSGRPDRRAWFDRVEECHE